MTQKKYNNNIIIKLKKKGKGIIYAEIDPKESSKLKKKIPTIMK